MTSMMKRKLIHSGFVVFGIMLFAGLALSVYDSHAGWRKKPRTLPKLISTFDKYRLYSGIYKINELPWIFDGGKRTHGKVLAIWSADSATTKAACKNEWANDKAYALLCDALEDKMILAVDIDNTDPALVMYIPVARQKKIIPGQQIVFTAGHATQDGSVQLLPKFIHALPNT